MPSYFATELESDPRGRALVLEVLRQERRRIAAGAIETLGLRFTGG